MESMSAAELFQELTKIDVTINLLLVLVLLVVKPPKKHVLKAYRKTLHAIIIALLLISAVNIMELADNYGISNKNFLIITTLIVASYQIFLFSSTIINMLDSSFYTLKRLIIELIPTTILSIISSILYHLAPGLPLTIIFAVFAIWFGFQVVYYTYHYFKTEKRTIQKLDNFFSEEISKSLKWTRAAFGGMLFCGIFTLLSLIQNQHLSIVFTICYTAYYAYFTLHYLNYFNTFFDIKSALETPVETTIKTINRSYEQLEEAIKHWENTKGYTETGVTIDQVAQQLKTNRTYLSNYMNMHRKVTFKEWINQLRIEDAKRLMKDHPDMPVAQIGVQVGIPDKSNFGRQFTRVTGISPKTWRKK
jgi:AraC-like DNA-binding protein